MMGIYDDKVEVVECEAQMEPFNLDQLNVVVATLEQRRQGFDISSVADIQENTQQTEQQQDGPRMQYLSTPKKFQTFDRLKNLKYNGNMLTYEGRSVLYWDQAKVIVEMADAYHVFTKSIFLRNG